MLKNIKVLYFCHLKKLVSPGNFWTLPLYFDKVTNLLVKNFSEFLYWIHKRF